MPTPTLVSAVATVTAQYIRGISYTPTFVVIRAQAPSLGYNVDLLGGIGGSSSWGPTTFTVTLSNAAVSNASFFVDVFIWSTLPFNGAPSADTLLMDDLFITLTYSDGSTAVIRPLAVSITNESSVYSTATVQGSIGPPTTAAYAWGIFNGFYNPPDIVFSNWFIPAVLPVIYGSSPALYPFKQRYHFYTAVSVMETNDSRRSISAPPTVEFDLTYDPMNIANRNTLKATFNSAKGQFDTGLSMLIDQLYTDLSFASDVFTSTENDLTIYTVKWSLNQARSSVNLFTLTTLTSSILAADSTCQVFTTKGMPVGDLPSITFDILIENEQLTVTANSVGTLNITRGVNGTTAADHAGGVAVRLAPGNPFPKITGGCLGQYPFDQMVRFKTIASQIQYGPKFTYAEYAAGLANFPTTGLGAWKFEETLLSENDAAIRIAHFVSNWGNRYPFQYTDEDGTVYPVVYYKSPVLEILRNFYNDTKITLDLVQMQS